MIRQITLCFIALIILNGCGSLQQPVQVPVEWHSHQNQLKQITTYNISGKLGYISPKERRSFNFQWKKFSRQNQLRLTTFLGQTVLKIDIGENSARIETYEGEVYTDKSPEALIEKLTGLKIPLSPLSQWILGLPSKADHFTLNSGHTLETLDKTLGKEKWRVKYDDYTDINYRHNLLPLPSKLSLSQGQTKINLRISQWNIKQ
ncbi:Outer-membrane lipoprotein LolB precursor [Vibrio aerogenes CECT 7868]|uniref:Outer-membrane lipoprotein LolB n=1 Tax=Vibrio aerogenes CECT 7868 TaxID=1216006 RepID=A0A1M5WA30_9VIBR|nr:lipoprotein insertase outer membrane protein LolB [Vibrio aerogenes]SHH84352.1 Outer-membrane lipoprotein LolB precursor [Vibrio aerogenes CECT 7868]